MSGRASSLIHIGSKALALITLVSIFISIGTAADHLPFLRRYAKPAAKPIQKKQVPKKKAQAKRRIVSRPVKPTTPRAAPTPLARRPVVTPTSSVSPPPAYASSPATPPNTTSSSAVLPLHPSAQGRKPPRKTIFLDMTKKYY
jgi:hypothetical protein